MALPENVKAIIDGHEQRGEPIPERYLSPEVIAEAQPYLKAFWSLCEDRQIGFGGRNGILFTAIDRYAERIGITDPDEYWTFEAMIRACDAIWLKYANASGTDKQQTVSEHPLSLREMFTPR